MSQVNKKTSKYKIKTSKTIRFESIIDLWLIKIFKMNRNTNHQNSTLTIYLQDQPMDLMLNVIFTHGTKYSIPDHLQHLQSKDVLIVCFSLFSDIFYWLYAFHI